MHSNRLNELLKILPVDSFLQRDRLDESESLSFSRVAHEDPHEDLPITAIRYATCVDLLRFVWWIWQQIDRFRMKLETGAQQKV